MTGQYNSYGRVFDDVGGSAKWISYPWSAAYDWNKGGRQPGQNVCDLMFSDDKSNGIAAVHTRCGGNKAVPTTRSDGDPDQGWGRYVKSKLKYYKHVVYKK
jgi:hypothetical protein